MKKKENGGTVKYIVVAIVAAVVSGATAGILSYRFAYQKGQDEKVAEAREAIESVATAMKQKREIMEKLGAEFSGGLQDFTADNIIEYAEKLERLSGATENDFVREKFKSLAEAARKFKEVYDRGDNEETQAEFERLRAEVATAEEAINNELDGKVRQSIEKLDLYASE